ncbi:MAG: hypothetical protein XD98_0196 [Microgenomates bacterium 39_6]|nr:MAG: hypothetical protein XD98_0196 [Microgenomates bacterium 39_6]
MAKDKSNPQITDKTRDNNSLKIPFMPEHLDEPHEIKAKVKEELGEFQKVFIEELGRFITSAFGLLAALAWRGVIQEFVDSYIRRFFGEISGLVSELFFALVITTLAVLVAWRLTKIKQRLFTEEEEEKKEEE